MHNDDSHQLRQINKYCRWQKVGESQPSDVRGDVSITAVQGLMNVSLKVWEELITQVGTVSLQHAGKMTKFNYMYFFFKNV
jgi:hypothetical protein